MSIVFFEAETFEVEALSAEALSRMVVETGTLNRLLDCHPGCELAVIGVGSRVTEAELDRLPRLRMVLARATGLDHIDAAACGRRAGVVTDHLAWATREARDRYMGVVEREILAWGQPG